MSFHRHELDLLSEAPVIGVWSSHGLLVTQRILHLGVDRHHSCKCIANEKRSDIAVLDHAEPVFTINPLVGASTHPHRSSRRSNITSSWLIVGVGESIIVLMDGHQWLANGLEATRIRGSRNVLTSQ